ncbi:MAG: TetR/AcrR family transcriptional regulator, partial [Micromonosporaceae bacterium]|nr:TetR/AcrR family transcriptional regulator [Micromonosporaceae bacterium]
FDHHEAHPDFIRLVSIENVHHGEHIAQLASLRHLNTAAIDLIDEILARGRAQQLFREDIDAIDVHMMISAFCVFRVANRYTFGTLFGRDLVDAKLRGRYRRMLGEMIVAYLTGR